MTDKEKLTEMLVRAGFAIDENLWRDLNSIGVMNHAQETVGFSFDDQGNLKDVWGRDW